MVRRTLAALMASTVRQRPPPAMSLAEARRQRWHVVDASGQHVGRLAARLAPVLVGKYKPIWEPCVGVPSGCVNLSRRHRHEHGDFVVVLNAAEVEFTGKKWTQKVYYRHSGYPGGLKMRTAAEVHRRKPGEVLRRAVSGMLPKNKLRQIYMSRLKIYPTEDHPHQAQVAGQRAAWSPLEDIVSTQRPKTFVAPGIFCDDACETSVSAHWIRCHTLRPIRIVERAFLCRCSGIRPHTLDLPGAARILDVHGKDPLMMSCFVPFSSVPSTSCRASPASSYHCHCVKYTLGQRRNAKFHIAVTLSTSIAVASASSEMMSARF